VQVIGRQTRSGNKLWYEVLKNGRKENDTDWEPLQFLEKMAPYVLKLVRNYDEECKSAASGMALRPITAIEVRKHLGDFGIDEDLASQKIKRMSGGQRSRLVLAAANWSRPHVIALDEPTNYLDNDTLAALTHALKTFQGGVVTISHNQAFVKELCNETWLVENGTVVINKLK
jgi:ATPase subunit of ABC transporter with duplicated ATPase domains